MIVPVPAHEMAGLYIFHSVEFLHIPIIFCMWISIYQYNLWMALAKAETELHGGHNFKRCHCYINSRNSRPHFGSVADKVPIPGSIEALYFTHCGAACCWHIGNTWVFGLLYCPIRIQINWCLFISWLRICCGQARAKNNWISYSLHSCLALQSQMCVCGSSEGIL